MRDHGREFTVGIVFFALLGVLGMLTFTLGKDSLERKEEATFKFREVSGLIRGADVWINGVPSGTVEEVRLDQKGGVEAVTTMRTDLAQMDLGEGATVSVKSKSALGGAIISIETNQKGGKKTFNEMMGTTWKATTEPFQAVGEKIGEVTDRLEKLLEDTAEGQSLLGDLLKPSKLREDVGTIVADWKDISDGIKAGKGTLGALVNDRELYDRLNSSVASLERFTEEARAGKGLLGRLMNDPETSDRFDRVLANLDEISRNAREGKGTLGKLLSDEALYEDARKAVASLQEFAKQLNEGDGLLHQLAYDGQAGQDFKTTMADLRATFADIRAGKGTLGKFVKDETLYEDIRGALRSLQRSFEEGRENAPILTFAGFLFKTF